MSAFDAWSLDFCAIQLPEAARGYFTTAKGGDKLQAAAHGESRFKELR